MNKSMKLAVKQLPKLGCMVQHESQDRVVFRLLNDVAWTCNKHTPVQLVQSVINSQRGLSRARSGDYLSAFPEAVGAPRLDVGDYHVTGHFRVRMRQMLAQGLRIDEITQALLKPTVVRVNEDNGNWIYCGARIGVIVAKPSDDLFPLITVLWATDELWAQNPREVAYG